MKHAKVVSITIMHAVQFGVATLIVLTVSVSHAQLPETRVLYANSLCKYPMRIMVHHKDSQSDHHTHAWYFFGPYEENRLVANDVVLRQVVGESLYVYAETIEGRYPLVWQGRDAKTRPSKNGQKGSLFLPRMWTSSRGSCSDLGPHSLWWCMPI
jgi:hypothetical protein